MAWWLMDAAFLTYAPPAIVSQAFVDAGITATVQVFSGRSTQCYVISSADRHVVSFRGTQVDAFWPAILDWAVDFRIESGTDVHGDTVHAGFSRALDKVWSAVVAHLRAAIAQPPNRPLWITGHSLGASLATLAASRCADEPGHLALSARYTFGSPRVGDQRFGSHIPAPVY